MTFTVLDRVLLFDCLPQTGDIATLRVLQALREAVALSEEEAKTIDYTVHEGEGRVTWDATKAVDKDIPITPKARKIIVAALTRLSDAQKLSPQHLPLCDRFLDTADDAS